MSSMSTTFPGSPVFVPSQRKPYYRLDPFEQLTAQPIMPTKSYATQVTACTILYTDEQDFGKDGLQAKESMMA